jgi:hypothetical protein
MDADGMQQASEELGRVKDEIKPRMRAIRAITVGNDGEIFHVVPLGMTGTLVGAMAGKLLVVFDYAVFGSSIRMVHERPEYGTIEPTWAAEVDLDAVEFIGTVRVGDDKAASRFYEDQIVNRLAREDHGIWPQSPP